MKANKKSQEALYLIDATKNGRNILNLNAKFPAACLYRYINTPFTFSSNKQEDGSFPQGADKV